MSLVIFRFTLMLWVELYNLAVFCTKPFPKTNNKEVYNKFSFRGKLSSHSFNLFLGMRYAKHLKVDPSAATGLAESLSEVVDQAAENFSSMDNGDLLIEEIMGLFHQAFDRDNKLFVNELFFECQRSIRLTRKHQVYIYAEWERLKDGDKGESYLIQLVNLYRNIVSDMFDPYLSIIIACLKMVEGNFTSFLGSNLSASEFNKYQYAAKRLRDSNLMKGYFPIIRNAVSHSGTHSIDYLEKCIVFKKIERSDSPKVKEVLKVSEAELLGHIQSLIDFTTAIDVSMNIFGLDIIGFIKDQKDISHQFAEKLASVEAFELWRKNCDDFYLPVWADESRDERSKQEHFARIFAEECARRKLPAKQIVFKKDKLLLIEVPKQPIAMDDEQQLIERMIELIRYCVLAEPFFNPIVNSYVVAELSEDDQGCLQVWLQGTDLNDYSVRKANMYDLLSDGNFYRDKLNLNISVDFETLERIQFTSFDAVRKGRQRS